MCVAQSLFHFCVFFVRFSFFDYRRLRINHRFPLQLFCFASVPIHLIASESTQTISFSPSLSILSLSLTLRLVLDQRSRANMLFQVHFSHYFIVFFCFFSQHFVSSFCLRTISFIVLFTVYWGFLESFWTIFFFLLDALHLNLFRMRFFSPSFSEKIGNWF